MKSVNEEEEKRSRERGELIEIHEQAISSLKSHIALNKNKSCNSCLLYINEKEDFKRKAEQEVRVLQRMERDHHVKKEAILKKCQEAMVELERNPKLHSKKLTHIEEALRVVDAERKAMEQNYQNIQALLKKRVSEADTRKRRRERSKNGYGG